MEGHLPGAARLCPTFWGLNKSVKTKNLTPRGLYSPTNRQVPALCQPLGSISRTQSLPSRLPVYVQKNDGASGNRGPS